MSARRPTAPPPDIPGYRYLQHLGTGGFANVYLYEQDRPRRKVAVKVLLSDLKTESAKNRFEAEANLMAQLSTHPYIVTIYEADITADNHSYLAMEYCSRPSLDVRYKSARLGVEEVLAIGIQVASAVETAHRAGIAHRDIKPANILTTDYNRPALTDFGISGTTALTADGEQGLSIPWSPPEAFRDGATDGILVDVWALGATVYTLLAGRSPFVLPAGGNSQRELMDRIISVPLPPTGRADVPASLELALATAMAKPSGSRYQSAYSFALALQRVQSELNLSATGFEVLEDTGPPSSSVHDVGDRTRVRGVVSIDPEAPEHHQLVSHELAAQRMPAPWPERTQDSTGGTVRRGADPVTVPESQHSRARWLKVATGVGLTAAALGIAGAVVLGGSQDEKIAGPGLTQEPPDAVAGLEGNVPPPEALTVRTSGADTVFTWQNPDPREGDLYIWRTVTATSDGDPVRTKRATATVAGTAGGQTCIEVQVVRLNGRASEPAAVCSGP